MLRADTEIDKRSKDEVLSNVEGTVTYSITQCDIKHGIPVYSRHLLPSDLFAVI